MAAPMQIKEPMLPWVEGNEDRMFRRMVMVMIILFLIAGVIANSLKLPEPEQKQLVDVSPRLAQLILEKKNEPPPPPPKPKPKEKKEEKPKPKPKPKEKKVEKPKPKPKPEPERREQIREKVMQTGLLAEMDELSDLRESFDFAELAELPQVKTGKQAKTEVATVDVLTAKATQSSSGIKTDTLSRKIKTSELAQRKTTQVKSNIASKEKIAKVSSPQAKARSASRSQEEIERVFQKNKGAIDTIYNRALRKDPSLQGKVVFELTIAPSGQVTKCVIVSSEIADKKLEKRLVSKIKKFKFASKQVPVITVSYPIDFLPS